MGNKVCIVTGASRGMGRGIALVLAKEAGCHVYATARDKEALDALAEEVSQIDSDGTIAPCELDQNDDKAVQNFVENIKSSNLFISNRKAPEGWSECIEQVFESIRRQK